MGFSTKFHGAALHSSDQFFRESINRRNSLILSFADVEFKSETRLEKGGLYVHSRESLLPRQSAVHRTFGDRVCFHFTRVFQTALCIFNQVYHLIN
jgi:hypothetical protein